MAGSAWTSTQQFEDRVMEWHEAGFQDFVFYDPPYARAGVARAEPDVIERLLSETLPRLRADLA